MPKKKEVYRHGQKCDCPSCIHRRLLEWDNRVAQMFEPRAPGDAGQCIPVRGHFRRSTNYLKKDPKFRELVMERIKGLIEEESDK